MESLLNKLLGEKKKSCIVKQHYINIGGFATQLEAYRLDFVLEVIHKVESFSCKSMNIIFGC